MKIDYAIMSCGSDPYYLDFWPIVARTWKEKFNVTPVLIWVPEKMGAVPPKEHGLVFCIPPKAEFSLHLQLLGLRYWLPSTFPEAVCIISDIDMLPMSRWYFLKQLEGIPDDAYVHLNPCLESYGHLPSCYHVAKGKTYQRLLRIENSHQVLTEMKNTTRPPDLSHDHGDWYKDELWATQRLAQWNGDITALKRDGGQGGHRLDRSEMFEPGFKPDVPAIHAQSYYDCHFPRPYSRYKEMIDTVVKANLA